MCGHGQGGKGYEERRECVDTGRGVGGMTRGEGTDKGRRGEERGRTRTERGTTAKGRVPEKANADRTSRGCVARRQQEHSAAPVALSFSLPPPFPFLLSAPSLPFQPHLIACTPPCPYLCLCPFPALNRSPSRPVPCSYQIVEGEYKRDTTYTIKNQAALSLTVQLVKYLPENVVRAARKPGCTTMGVGVGRSPPCALAPSCPCPLLTRLPSFDPLGSQMYIARSNRTCGASSCRWSARTTTTCTQRRGCA